MIAPIAPQPALRPLVGRERERALLRAQLDAGLAGRGGLVLVGGAAGIGKTTLAEAVCEEATRRGALVLVGRCFDLTETPPYGPWVEITTRLPDRDGLPAPFGQGEAATSQAALITRVNDAFACAATRQPLVLLLEDLHWADPASIDLLRIIGRQIIDRPILILATYRNDEIAGEHPLAKMLPLLLREARATRLTLPRLTIADTRTLARIRLQLPIEDEMRLVEYLYAHGEGNPFYQSELLRSLEEEGLLRLLAGEDTWVLDDLTGARIPALLRQVIAARVGRLGEYAGRLLGVAAVIGQEVALDLWMVVCRADTDTITDVVGRAVEARVLAEIPTGQGVRFVHALVRDALYTAIPLPRRRALHLRAAEALLATPAPDPDTTAHHLHCAGDPREAEWLVRAARRAQRAYAWLAAADRYRAALALLADTPSRERASLIASLATLVRYAEPARSAELWEEAAQLAAADEDHALAAASRFERGYSRISEGDLARGIAEMAEQLATLEALPAAERARLPDLSAQNAGPDEDFHRGILVRWLANAGRYTEARALGARMLARKSGTTPRGLAGLAQAAAALGDPEGARCLYADAVAAYQAARQYQEVGSTLEMEQEVILLTYRADQPIERRRVMDEAETAWTRGHGAQPYLQAHFVRLPSLLIEGAWDEVYRLAREVLAAGGVVAGWRSLARRILAWLAYFQGDPEQAWSLLREGLPAGIASEPGGGLFLWDLDLLRLGANLARVSGDLVTARAWLECHDRWLAWNGVVLGRAEGFLGWANYHRAAGNLATARERGEHALILASEPRQPLVLLATHRVLGELATAAGQYADARTNLTTALALAHACAAPYERALTLVALAELRLAEGCPMEASRSLTEAQGIFAALGARPALARAEGLAAHLHGEPHTPLAPTGAIRPTALPYPARLTAREVEVLRLIAAGQSNRQMAVTLCRSERTVERHLENIYRKIDAHNKADATAFAFRHGII